MRDSADSYDPAFGRVRRARSKRQRKFYQPHDDEATYTKRAWELQRLAGADADDAIDGLPEGDRWSTWDQSTPTERGPKPHPTWLVTDLAAVDYELGVLKTGKEADVFLVRRGVPGTGRSCLLAAKRYRDATHRQFHRDVGYLEGRRVRESRVNRAVAKRSSFGREAIAGQWANAEFNALVQQAEIAHVADQRLAVEHRPGDGLDLGFQDMGVERRAMRPRYQRGLTCRAPRRWHGVAYCVPGTPT